MEEPLSFASGIWTNVVTEEGKNSAKKRLVCGELKPFEQNRGLILDLWCLGVSGQLFLWGEKPCQDPLDTHRVLFCV